MWRKLDCWDSCCGSAKRREETTFAHFCQLARYPCANALGIHFCDIYRPFPRVNIHGFLCPRVNNRARTWAQGGI